MFYLLCLLKISSNNLTFFSGYRLLLSVMTGVPAKEMPTLWTRPIFTTVHITEFLNTPEHRCHSVTQIYFRRTSREILQVSSPFPKALKAKRHCTLMSYSDVGRQLTPPSCSTSPPDKYPDFGKERGSFRLLSRAICQAHKVLRLDRVLFVRSTALAASLDFSA